jgi:hypothetical protein
MGLRIVCGLNDLALAMGRGPRPGKRSRSSLSHGPPQPPKVGSGCSRGGSVTATVARRGLPGKMADDDLVYPPPVPARDHPARRVALCVFHAQQSRRRGPARRTWAGCLLRNGATVGLEVRATICPRIASSTPTADVAMMEWMPPPDGIAMCQGGDVCRIPRNEEGTTVDPPSGLAARYG